MASPTFGSVRYDGIWAVNAKEQQRAAVRSNVLFMMMVYEG
jgi:hypothetical protein